MLFRGFCGSNIGEKYFNTDKYSIYTEMRKSGNDTLLDVKLKVDFDEEIYSMGVLSLTKIADYCGVSGKMGSKELQNIVTSFIATQVTDYILTFEKLEIGLFIEPIMVKLKEYVLRKW